MLLRHRGPRIESRPVNTVAGHEHLQPEKVAVLRWLVESRVEYVLVGAVATALRSGAAAGGPVAIVPAPYGRNLDRLSHALWSAHARLRIGLATSGGAAGAAAGGGGGPETMPVKMNAEKLLRGPRWTLQCGAHDLDVEGRGPGLPRYQELLYEAEGFKLDPGLKVEVASPEDIERYAHRRQSGDAEIRVTRTARTTAAS